jgi:alpha-maltose-1-phosphate synthase
LATIYELPTPYWKLTAQICEAESIRRPEWASTLPSAADLAALGPQRDEELQLADLVIVPSHFVRESLCLAPAFKAKVVVVPYGCPETNPQPQGRIAELRNPLRLLFAGTLSQSKGVADLLEAIAPLGDRVRLSVAGSCPSSTSALPAALRCAPPHVAFLGQLNHASLMDEMNRHDLLVLPTLYEGLSLVSLEAMSQGLPVLATFNSGLASLVENGVQAVLLPAQDPVGLRNELERLNANRHELIHIGCNAKSWAAANSWTLYRQRLTECIQPFISGAAP